MLPITLSRGLCRGSPTCEHFFKKAVIGSVRMGHGVHAGRSCNVGRGQERLLDCDALAVSCAQAVQEREDALRAAQLSYTNATFHVELVQQSDVTGSATIITGEKVLDSIGP